MKIPSSLCASVLLYLSALSLLTSSSELPAQTWTGAVNGNWSTAGNWNPSLPTGNNNPAGVSDTITFNSLAVPVNATTDAGANDWYLGQLNLNNSAALQNMTLSGSRLNFAAGAGGITVGAGGQTTGIVTTINNNITVNKSNFTITGAGTGTTSFHRLDMNGSITNTFANGRITFNSGGTFANSGFIYGAINSPNLTVSGVGTWVFGNASSQINTFTSGAAEIRLTGAGGFGSASTPTVTLNPSSGQTTRFELAGNNLTSTLLTSNSVGTRTIRNTTNTSVLSTLTLNGPVGTNHVHNGLAQLLGHLKVVVTNGNNLTVANTTTSLSTYDGGTDILQGSTVTFGSAATAGVVADRTKGTLGSGGVTFDNGTLIYASSNTTDQSLRGPMTILSGGGTINVAGNNVTYTSSIGNSGAGTLTVVSSGGSLTLGAANTYQGGTILATGSSLLATSVGALGAGDVDVNGTGVLTLGTLNAIDSTADLVLDATSDVNLNFAGSQSVFRLSLDGGTTFLAPGTYDATTNGGQLFGTGALVIAPVPEPGVIGLLAIGLMLGVMRVRARAGK